MTGGVRLPRAAHGARGRSTAAGWDVNRRSTRPDETIQPQNRTGKAIQAGFSAAC
jgi:hypothetical protein